MRNVLGVILTAAGVALIALPFSPDAAAVLAGVLLAVGALLLVIDWDAR